MIDEKIEHLQKRSADKSEKRAEKIKVE